MASNSSPSADTVFKVGGAVVAVLLLDKVLGLFGPENPGGEVDPGKGDDRPATLNEAEARQLADRIADDFGVTGLFNTPWERDEDVAVALMATVHNTNDVRLIANAYDTHGLVTSRNLYEAVAAYLDKLYKDVVNGDYARKGITIRF